MTEQYTVNITITKLIKRKKPLIGGWEYYAIIDDHGHQICKECYIRYKIEYVRRGVRE